MGCGHDRKRRKIEQIEKTKKIKDDRLSNLHDDLIHKILSFVSTKQAVQTSVLSSRWRFIWTEVPCLTFDNFRRQDKLSKFITRVLKSRNNKTEVTNVKLECHGKLSLVHIKRIMKYANSHNTQQLTVAYVKESKEIELPVSLLSCQSLKHLTLTGHRDINISSTWELPALTTLCLNSIVLCDKNYNDLFSKYPNLKNLMLSDCKTVRPNGFNICHSQLSSLTLENICYDVNIVAPQLKNLSVRKDYAYSWSTMKLCADGVRSLEMLDLCFPHLSVNASKIIDLLQRFHNVKFLTLNLEIVEILSSYVEVISDQPSPFVNLKSLKIYPIDLNLMAHKKVKVYAEVIRYLMSSSPSATFTMVSCEEIKALKHMKELQELLDQMKANSNLNTIHNKATMHDSGEVERERAELDPKMQCSFGERMTRIKTNWKDLKKQIKERETKIYQISSLLRNIDKIMTKVPKKKVRAELKARFGRLPIVANAIIIIIIIMNNLANV